MIYRKAEENDVQLLVELRVKQLKEEERSRVNATETLEAKQLNLRTEKSLTDLKQELFNYFSDGLTNDTLSVWVAADNEVIIATSGVCFFQYPPTLTNVTGRIAYITNVYTEPGYRGHGIATHLLDDVLKDIKKHHYQLVRLHASAQARSLYEKAGFTDVGGFMVKRMNQ